MIRNKLPRRVGAEKAGLSRLGSERRNSVADAKERRFPQRLSSKDKNAIHDKVLAFTTDLGLIAAGVAAAIGSVAFATIMISQDSRPAMLKENEYPEVFERSFRSRPHKSQNQPTNLNGQPIDYRTIDYNVTGSISKDGKGEAAQNNASHFNIDRSASSTNESTNNTYVMRFVNKDAALLESNHGYYIARRGTMLPGAGRVLSIARLGDKWILVTAKQIFTETGHPLP
jgi:hypothetical protein